MPLLPSQLCTVVSRGRTNATPHPLAKIVSSQGFEPCSVASVSSTQPLYHKGCSICDDAESTTFGRDSAHRHAGTGGSFTCRRASIRTMRANRGLAATCVDPSSGAGACKQKPCAPLGRVGSSRIAIGLGK